MIVKLTHLMIIILCINILPYRQADLAASAALQGICGEGAKSSMSLQPYMNFLERALSMHGMFKLDYSRVE